MFYIEIIKMKKIVFLIIGLVVCSCNSSKEKETELVEDVISPSVFKEKVAKLNYVEYGLDAKAKETFEAWDKYHELDNTITLLKAGDVTFFENEIKVINTFMKEFKESMPQDIKTSSIQARVLTLETKMFKLQSVLSLQNISEQEQLDAVRETLEAFSNLNLQINKKFEKEAQNIVKP